MDELIKKAVQIMQENLGINEVELSDAAGQVRLVRNVPAIWYYQAPWVPTYQFNKP
jgi:hypothetical protein